MAKIWPVGTNVGIKNTNRGGLTSAGGTNVGKIGGTNVGRGTNVGKNRGD